MGERITTNQFGGSWTRDKLRVLEAYLEAYQNVMKNKSFHLSYIDAFAGTGDIEVNSGTDSDDRVVSLFEEVPNQEPLHLGRIEGSARIALDLKHPFNEYIFIDRNPQNCLELEGLGKEFPALASRIKIECEDANDAIQNLCTRRDWYRERKRAVIFLDPYGMQVKWKTIECIANTHCMDTWYLFPMGIAVSRLLRKDGKIREQEKNKLSELFGTEEWQTDFYEIEPHSNLFGANDENMRRRASHDRIEKFLDRRLRQVFGNQVAVRKKKLYNSKGNPLYLLCFAAGNTKGAPTALKIAEYLLGR